ncbi:chorismate-binding protein [Pontibacter silvestris]|uniref:Chorismate-binding protein n=1 Tax=Pontibacter silvestris TaxID=2305183 RepID=A0ABW4WZE0_9BACT|nr:chorismate-binding protein [Pontibacter silvestris]MCC9135231.1 chorismate-binding protein [Pontibacter silvestris]
MTQASAALKGRATGAEFQNFTLQQIIGAAIAQRLAVAAWRLPNSSDINICISFSSDYRTGQPHLEESPFGFLFCPFHESEREANLFIKADLYYSTAKGRLQVAEDAPVYALEQYYNALAKQKSKPATQWHTLEDLEHQLSSPELFTEAVARAVEAIRAEKMEKVVLSRNHTQELPEAFELVSAFQALQEAYSCAFVSLVSVPEVGTWMGASPEILVSIDQNQLFKTVALAGTQPAAEGASTANAIWRQKEIEEQAMVERYILSCFKKLRLRDYSEVGPRTIVAGNLLHLRTDFKVDLKEVDFPTLGSDMLQLLHPTSAVCGLPKAPALQFILCNEGYDRSYYSGFLGPVNSADGTHIYVNLRCMQLLTDTAILYAGAGITAESDPQNELQETQHKMQTIAHILQQF